MRALSEAGADVNKAKENGVTPLFKAVEKGYKSVVETLIEAGADLNKTSHDGRTPMSCAM